MLSGVFFTVQIENLAYFYVRFIWPNDLEHVSHVALRTGMKKFHQ